MKVSAALFAICFAVLCAAPGSPVRAAGSPATTPILVELFTSEGCSSCPPVDAWAQKIDASQPVPGTQLIVLSEHVDYWNHDGWKDPYSSASVTERQGAYAHALGMSELYTPQIIIDGSAELRLNNPQQAGEILKKAAATPMVPLRIESVTIEGSNPPVLRAHVEADASSETHGADVYVAVALDHAESQVLRGENSGKHLTHVAVVQSLKKVGKLEPGKSFSQDCQVKLKSRTDPTNIRIVAFVQESGPGRVLGAALRKPSTR